MEMSNENINLDKINEIDVESLSKHLKDNNAVIDINENINVDNNHEEIINENTILKEMIEKEKSCLENPVKIQIKKQSLNELKENLSKIIVDRDILRRCKKAIQRKKKKQEEKNKMIIDN